MQNPYETAKRWRHSLTTGDEALLPSGYICTVVRTTKTQVIFAPFGREIRYSRERGREVGSTSYATIAPVNDEVRAKIATKAMRQRFDSLVYRHSLTDKEIHAMLTALDAHRASLAAEQEPAV